MSIQTALQFLQYTRQDEKIKSEIISSGPALTMEDLIKIGSNNHFHFSSKDIQNAFNYDWKMRWMRYQAEDAQLKL